MRAHTAKLSIGVAVGAACLLGALAAAVAAATFPPVQVSVPARPGTAADVQISFQPRGQLPRGGFYYAVLVLHGYPTPGGGPPSCSVSSDMARTEYVFPHGSKRLRLTLLRPRSGERRWCAGATYLGAVYAVPHRPRCSPGYGSSCYGKSTQVGPCWIVGEGHRVCGVVVRRPPYSYPGGLPRPLDASARLVGRFQVRF